MKKEEVNEIKEGKKESNFSLPKFLVSIVIIVILLCLGFVGVYYYLQQSGDNALIKELNALIDESNKESIETVSDANTLLKESGFALESLKPSNQKLKYGFDIDQKRMYLIDEKWRVYPKKETPENTRNIFVFVDEESDLLEAENITTKYSYYLQKNFKFLETNKTSTLSVHYGIDLGVNTNVDTLVYTGNNDIESTIYANDLDTVISFDTTANINLYGLVKEVEVSNVGTLNSFGEIGYCEILKGTVNFKANSEVGLINKTGSESVCNANSNAKIGNAISNNANKSNSGNVKFNDSSLNKEQLVMQGEDVLIAKHYGEVSVVNGSYAPSYYTFEQFISYVNIERNDCKNAVVSLHKDVDLTAINFTPIGTENTKFKGVFDGRYHYLTLSSSYSKESNLNKVVFQNTEGATIKNVNYSFK